MRKRQTVASGGGGPWFLQTDNFPNFDGFYFVIENVMLKKQFENFLDVLDVSVESEGANRKLQPLVQMHFNGCNRVASQIEILGWLSQGQASNISQLDRQVVATRLIV